MFLCQHLLLLEKKVKEPKFFITSEIQRRVKYGVWDWNSYKNLFDGVTSEKQLGKHLYSICFIIKQSYKKY